MEKQLHATETERSTALCNSSKIRQVHLFFIQPSRYDEDGYVIRHWKGVLPSNTLAVLSALTNDLVSRKFLGKDIAVKVHLLDEAVHKINCERIAATNRRRRTKAIVALAGVQSNQFPRAADLAREFRTRGVTVLIGGFHVSGSLALFEKIPQEIQELVSLGVTVVAGEVEEAWGTILRDAVCGTLKPVYNLLDKKPDLSHAPVPSPISGYLRRFLPSNHGSIDCGRGCPFHCSFCTIINVQGHRMRFRDAEMIKKKIRENYLKKHVNYYFFTDDNFSRNKNWEKIFDALIELREQENIPINFMMQVDVLSYRIKNFVRKAAAAGCTQVFVGMESLNEKNLKAEGKTQNEVSDYKNLIAAYHNACIATHAGYIIGFPFDTHDSVLQDVERLKNEVKVDQASFFMLTPLPGSMDHKRMVEDGRWMEPDLNLFDSFHETIHHPNFKPGEWQQTYWEAWESFLSFDNMKAILQQAHPKMYWNIFRNFLWYKYSIAINREHPMVGGFIRWKDRRSRRPGYAIDPLWQHARKRLRELANQTKLAVKLLFEFEELWLQTRKRTPAEEYVLAEIKSIQSGITSWRALRAKELQQAYVRAAERLRALSPSISISLRIPPRFILFLHRLNPLVQSLTFSRKHVQAFWEKTIADIKHGRLFALKPHWIAFNAVRDFVLGVRFLQSLLTL